MVGAAPALPGADDQAAAGDHGRLPPVRTRLHRSHPASALPEDDKPKQGRRFRGGRTFGADPQAWRVKPGIGMAKIAGAGGAGAGGGNRTPDIQLGKLTFYL
jgi:hypothetical protein